MTKELTRVKWAIEGKYYGCINARDYAREKAESVRDEEAQGMYMRMYAEFDAKARVLEDIIDELRGEFEEWE